MGTIKRICRCVVRFEGHDDTLEMDDDAMSLDSDKINIRSLHFYEKKMRLSNWRRRRGFSELDPTGRETQIVRRPHWPRMARF